MWRTARTCISVAGVVFIGLLAFQTHRIQALEQALATPNSFVAHQADYRALLRVAGAGRGQDILAYIAPPNTRSHALGHEAGYFLYEQDPARGFLRCKKYFNGSCTHGFLEKAIAEKGIASLRSIVDSCVGERTLYEARECAHGAGHALLVLATYQELPKALEGCERSFAENSRAVSDCFDGVFMENNYGGFNVPPPDRWYKPDDPLYPCTDLRVRAYPAAFDACWFMQSQSTLNAAMYPRFSGDIEKVAAYCRNLDAEERRVCFMGLARQIQSRESASAEAILASCRLLGENAVERCAADAAESAYAFGAQREAVELCEHAGAFQEECYQTLYERISTTAFDSYEERVTVCKAFANPAIGATCLSYITKTLHGENM